MGRVWSLSVKRSVALLPSGGLLADGTASSLLPGFVLLGYRAPSGVSQSLSSMWLCLFLLSGFPVFTSVFCACY